MVSSQYFHGQRAINISKREPTPKRFYCTSKVDNMTNGKKLSVWKYGGQKWNYSMHGYIASCASEPGNRETRP